MKLKDKIIKNFNILLIIGCFICISGMTVGYALLSTLIDISGSVTLQVGGKMEITRFELVGSSNFDEDNSSTSVSSDLSTVNFNLKFKKDDTISTNYYAVYEVDVENNTFFDYTFNAMNFTINSIVGSDGGTGTVSTEVSGISNGDVIQKDSMVTITVKFTLNGADGTQEYDVSGSTSMDADDNPITNETFAVAVNTSSVDFRGSSSAKTVTYSVISTYDNSFSCTPRVNNSAFTIASATAITVPANSDGTTNYSTSVTLNGSPKFYSDSVALKITLDCTSLGAISSTNTFTAYVDVYEEQDEQAPTINSVTVSQGSTEGNVNVSFSGTDNSNGNITYTVTLYNSSGTQIGSDTVTASSGDTASKTFTVSQGTSTVSYYATVTGTDTSGNTSAAKTSSSVSIRWRATVDISGLSNVNSSNSATEVLIGSSYTTKLTGSNSRSLTTSSVDVTMNGTTVIDGGSVVSGVSGVTYSDGTITINSVTGDISITASSSCLIEGTKVLLADGTYKNIEDIWYDDLLAVWDYSKEKINYAYPVFVETMGISKNYQKITLEDGTTLGVVGDHGIYNFDLNRFVLTNNKEEFYEGATVAKIEDGNIVRVKVSKIEYIEEKVRTYHIVTTGYFNIISNDILTTEPNIMVSNQYGFTENIGWPSGVREEVINNEENLYPYSEFSDFMPYFIYKGLRVNEGKFVVEQGYISLDLLKLYLMMFPANPLYYQTPIQNSDGVNMWMVTTSLDDVTEDNSVNYLVREGDKYIIPEHDGVKCYYSFIDNKYFYPGDELEVYVGTYLEAIYEEDNIIEEIDEEKEYN